MARPARVEVTTYTYQRSHGKQPRGYGSWGFFMDAAQSTDKVFWHTGNYSDAKAAAVSHAREQGVTYVAVAP